MKRLIAQKLYTSSLVPKYNVGLLEANDGESLHSMLDSMKYALTTDDLVAFDSAVFTRLIKNITLRTTEYENLAREGGRQAGYDKGYKEGYDDGYDEGYEDGVAD